MAAPTLSKAQRIPNEVDEDRKNVVQMTKKTGIW